MMGEHHNQLSALVNTVRLRWRRMSALRAWTVAAGGASLVIALALTANSLVLPEGGALIALWIVAATASVAVIGWCLRPLRGGPTSHQVARYIEECCPELEDALVTAFAHGNASSRGAGPADPPSAMAEAVAADAARRTSGLDLDRIISTRQLRAAAIRAAAATLLLCVVGGLAAAPAGRAARVLAIYLFPDRFALEVLPGNVKVREGAPLRIHVQVPGAVEGLIPTLRISTGSRSPSPLGEARGAPSDSRGAGLRESRDIRMQPATDGFAVAFDRVVEGFTYAVTAANVSSREYSVTVIRPPHVERIDLRYEYPAAFGMQPRQDDDGGDIYGPAGTRVHVTVHPDKPVTDAALTLSDGQHIPLASRSGVLEGELTIADDGSYRIALADGDGLSNPGDTEYFIRTLEDRPPDVRIVKPASDRQVTPIEEVPVEAWADDDFGVASLELVYAVRGGEPKVIPFDRDGAGTSVHGRRTIYVEDLGVKPGDFVTYYARARDVSRGKRSTEARSDIFFLEVTPFEEEFVASQGQGAGGGDEAMDDMVQVQKDIITATWKLDTRGMQAGARSADDIRTVSKAQGELRNRALGIVQQMQRTNNVRRLRPGGGRGSTPQPEEPSENAMAKAADAMLQAQQRLDALKTSDALPHEMTALNELLRAQSETKRREVQQQQANGNGRGNNRQQQDLSSLFDRELARQQQTNYETPTSSETRKQDAEKKDDTLDKIKELARRQDELNKQQQEIAKRGTSEDEQRRQLERLTREQMELRREAEELAQQLQQRQNKQSSQSPSQSGQGGRGGQGAQGSSQQGGRGSQSDPGQQQASRELQQISEEMQGAVSEMRRDNAQQASERGNRAAERLKELEQRMRSAQPDDRRRAMGELQLESQQLADAQRKLAAEGGARGRGENAQDAARRRAGEQGRLAERTQRLEESVKQMAAGGSGTERERNALSEAARELERQKLSDRMRKQPDGREGQQIASQLDKLSERLGSANGQSAASQQISDQLSRIRELREKLTELDRQLKEQNDSASKGTSPGRGGQGGSNVQNGDSQQPWDQARSLVDELRKEKAAEIESPPAEGFNPGRSAPGTEAWKQDFSKWETLKTQIAASLERAESSAAARLRDQQSKDRLSAGASQAVPEQYRRMVDKYYEALASQSPKEKR